MKHLITSLVLACVLIQTAFGPMRDSVVICLGGGHDHGAQCVTTTPIQQPTKPNAEACCEGCSHSDQWPAATVNEEHEGCPCTDIELALIELLYTPRTINIDDESNSAEGHILAAPQAHALAALSLDHTQPPSRLAHQRCTEHTAGTLRLAIMRSTRWLL